MLITLYGINNIGKTTQALRLVERLKESGHDAVYVKFPVYEIEPTGTYLNAFLRSGDAQNISEEELQMWFTLNRYQFEPTLKKWLAEGKIVIAEDYIGTGIAWGTVKGASTDWLESMNTHLVKEDLAIMIDGERFMAAAEDGHLHESNDEFMKRSRQVHLELAERYDWTVVPLQNGVEKMNEVLWKVLQLHIG
ncbi:MAG: thymidylate kinase [Oceanicoccus sp.]|jgi:thymidylate kinase